MTVKLRVRRALKNRSGRICEGCGHAEAREAHHRQFRSRGGSDEIVNLLDLCGWGNHTGCHGVAHSPEGEALGWSVRSGFDPAVVPALIVVDLKQVWVRFTPEGEREIIPSATALEYMHLIGAIKEGE